MNNQKDRQVKSINLKVIPCNTLNDLEEIVNGYDLTNWGNGFLVKDTNMENIVPYLQLLVINLWQSMLANSLEKHYVSSLGCPVFKVEQRDQGWHLSWSLPIYSKHTGI